MKPTIKLKDLSRPEFVIDREARVFDCATGDQLGVLRVTPEQLASLLAFKAIQKARGNHARTEK